MRAGTYVGKEKADRWIEDDGRAGMVAQSGRWWPDSWWDGHWLKRTRCGEWREKDGEAHVCHRRSGHKGEHAHSLAHLVRGDAAGVPARLLYPSEHAGQNRARRRKISDRQRVATDYRAYLEARYDDAEQDTRGVLVSNAGKARGIRGGQFFAGRRTSMRWASEELRAWFADNGPNLTASQFRAQASGGMYAGTPY